MPSLIRLLVFTAFIMSILLGGLYGAAVFLEPKQREVVKPIYGVTVRKP